MLDLGCGPGFASLDLARWVGPAELADLGADEGLHRLTTTGLALAENNFERDLTVLTLGPGRLDSLDIHLSPEWIQFNLTESWDESGVLISSNSRVDPE